MSGEYPAALIERKGALTTQLRRIDESVAHYIASKPEPGDLNVAGDEQHDVLDIEIDGEWYPVPEAETLTRAALHEVDQGLEDLGHLPKGGV